MRDSSWGSPQIPRPPLWKHCCTQLGVQLCIPWWTITTNLFLIFLPASLSEWDESIAESQDKSYLCVRCMFRKIIAPEYYGRFWITEVLNIARSHFDIASEHEAPVMNSPQYVGELCASAKKFHDCGANVVSTIINVRWRRRGNMAAIRANTHTHTFLFCKGSWTMATKVRSGLFSWQEQSGNVKHPAQSYAGSLFNFNMFTFQTHFRGGKKASFP